MGANLSWGSDFLELVKSLLFDEASNLALLIYVVVTGFIVGGWRLFLYYREDRFYPKIELSLLKTRFAVELAEL